MTGEVEITPILSGASEGWRRIGRQRRQEVLRVAGEAFQRGVPMPRMADFAAAWRSHAHAVSEHFRRLREAGELVTERRDGRLYVVRVTVLRTS